jgi:hypothetical protein
MEEIKCSKLQTNINEVTIVKLLMWFIINIWFIIPIILIRKFKNSGDTFLVTGGSFEHLQMYFIPFLPSLHVFSGCSRSCFPMQEDGVLTVAKVILKYVSHMRYSCRNLQ